MSILSLPAQAASSWRWTDAPSAWMPDVTTFTQGLRQAFAVKPSAALIDGLGLLGVPARDLQVSPMSARAALLGMERGCAFMHHEIRGRLAMPDALAPEVAVWEGGTVPQWREGVLHEPKYFSFFQDAPLPAFHPNHRRKWRAHEMLHAAQGFFWHPEMTRFSFYAGARLNEMLPVVHWYGYEEAWRPRCPAHQGQGARKAHCQACEETAPPWWTLGEETLSQGQEAAQRHLQSAMEHLSREWTACLQELSTGRVVPCPAKGLDSSSDSIGYLRGHWPRVTSYSFGAWVEMFLEPGRDYHPTLEGAFERAAQTTRDLTSGTLTFDQAAFVRRRTRRAIQDMAYRALLSLDIVAEKDPARAEQLEDAIQPALAAASSLISPLWDREADTCHEVIALLRQGLTQLTPHLPARDAQALLATGYLWPDLQASTGLCPGHQVLAGAKLLKEGLISASPMTAQALAQQDQDAAVMALGQSAHFALDGPLAQRVSAWVQATHTDTVCQELAQFEALLVAHPRADEEAEVFGVLAEDLDTLTQERGCLRPHKTLRFLTISGKTATTILGDETLASLPGVELAVVLVRGQARVMPLLDAALSRHLHEATEDHRQWLTGAPWPEVSAWLEEGFLVWLPAP